MQRIPVDIIGHRTGAIQCDIHVSGQRQRADRAMDIHRPVTDFGTMEHGMRYAMLQHALSNYPGFWQRVMPCGIGFRWRQRDIIVRKRSVCFGSIRVAHVINDWHSVVKSDIYTDTKSDHDTNAYWK